MPPVYSAGLGLEPEPPNFLVCGPLKVLTAKFWTQALVAKLTQSWKTSDLSSTAGQMRASAWKEWVMLRQTQTLIPEDFLKSGRELGPKEFVHYVLTFRQSNIFFPCLKSLWISYRERQIYAFVNILEMEHINPLSPGCCTTLHLHFQNLAIWDRYYFLQLRRKARPAEWLVIKRWAQVTLRGFRSMPSHLAVSFPSKQCWKEWEEYKRKMSTSQELLYTCRKLSKNKLIMKIINNEK